MVRTQQTYKKVHVHTLIDFCLGLILPRTIEDRLWLSQLFIKKQIKLTQNKGERNVTMPDPNELFSVNHFLGRFICRFKTTVSLSTISISYLQKWTPICLWSLSWALAGKRRAKAVFRSQTTKFWDYSLISIFHRMSSMFSFPVQHNYYGMSSIQWQRKVINIQDIDYRELQARWRALPRRPESYC